MGEFSYSRRGRDWSGGAKDSYFAKKGAESSRFEVSVVYFSLLAIERKSCVLKELFSDNFRSFACNRAKSCFKRTLSLVERIVSDFMEVMHVLVH